MNTKEYNRKYYCAHEETLKERHRKYYQENKEALKTHSREYRRKIKLERPWVAHFRNAKQRCNDPGSLNYKYYGGKGIKFKLTVGKIKTLYLMDNAKDMKKPSIDRIYNDGNYTFGNCRFIEQSENSRRQWRKED